MFRLPILSTVVIKTKTSAKYFEECLNVARDSHIAVDNYCRSYIHCQDETTSFKRTCSNETFFNVKSGKWEFDYDNICPGSNENAE